LGNRLVRAPKTSFIDTGILTFLLGINPQRLLHDATFIGPLFENFVLSELRKQLTWSEHQANLYHFRTAKNVEVDIVIEDRAGTIIGIETKYGKTVTSEDFKGLRHLQERAGNKFKRGIIIYTGAEVISVGNKFFALPVSALWST
jgi:uncharacterized protein